MKFFKWKLVGKTAVVTIHRPPANALATGLLDELEALLQILEEDDRVRVLIFHGEGRFFSAGAEIREFAGIANEKTAAEMASRGQRLFERVERFPKPVIAVIHGAALGGGLEFAMACHIRIVGEGAKLGLPELQLGLIPGYAGTQRLPRYVGMAKAAEMMLTAEPLSGVDAVRWGLANACYPDEELLERALELARKIEKKSPASVRAVLQLLQHAKMAAFEEGVSQEAIAFGRIFITEDAKEGIRAFLEKREPQFTGK
jgi:short chain enoyl-CoA hydratase (EC 4.2.1.17)